MRTLFTLSLLAIISLLSGSESPAADTRPNGSGRQSQATDVGKAPVTSASAADITLIYSGNGNITADPPQIVIKGELKISKGKAHVFLTDAIAVRSRFENGYSYTRDFSLLHPVFAALKVPHCKDACTQVGRLFTTMDQCLDPFQKGDVASQIKVKNFLENGVSSGAGKSIFFQATNVPGQVMNLAPIGFFPTGKKIIGDGTASDESTLGIDYCLGDYFAKLPVDVCLQHCTMAPINGTNAPNIDYVQTATLSETYQYTTAFQTVVTLEDFDLAKAKSLVEEKKMLFKNIDPASLGIPSGLLTLKTKELVGISVLLTNNPNLN